MKLHDGQYMDSRWKAFKIKNENRLASTPAKRANPKETDVCLEISLLNSENIRHIF